MAYHHIHYPPSHPLPDPTTIPFHISAPAPTDIWRKPPSHDVFNAPITYRRIPVSAFTRARATVTGDWMTLYDQGGLVLVLPTPPQLQKRRWIKCGIELYDGKPHMSVVTAVDEGADWSLSALSAHDAARGRVTIEVERKSEDEQEASVLWVYYVDGESGKRVPVREVTWAFDGVAEDGDMWVGVFAAKPTPDKREELVVTVHEFEIEEGGGQGK